MKYTHPKPGDLLQLASCAYLLASITQLFILDELLPLKALLFLSLLTILVFALVKQFVRPNHQYRMLYEFGIIFLMCFSLALSYISMRACQYLDHRLPEDLEQKEVYVHGYVSSLPKRIYGEQKEEGGRPAKLIRQDFDFSVSAFYPCADVYEQEASAGKTCEALPAYVTPKNIRLSIYRSAPDFFVKGGERYQFLVKLKRPRSVLNFSGFDYETWMFANNYHAKGYVREKGNNQALGQERRSLAFYREYIRQQILESISKGSGYSKPGNAQSLIFALVLGDRTYLSPKLQTLLADTGTAHLLAISGLHIALVCFGSYVLFYFLFRLVIRIFDWKFEDISPLLIKQSALLISLLMALIYALLSGFSLPAQRAFIMVCSYGLLLFFLRRFGFVSIFVTSLFLVLLWDPFSILQSSVFLSFAAVFLIHWSLLEKRVVSPQGGQGFFNSLRALFGTQFMVYLGLMPVLLTFFSRFFLLSLLCNLIAIPWVSFVVLPLCLFFTLFLMLASFSGLEVIEWFSSILLLLSEVSLEFLITFLSFFSENLNWELSFYFSSFASILLFIAIILWKSPLPLLVRATAWLIVLSLGIFISPLLVRDSDIPSAAFRLRVLDVGQGLAVLVETRNHQLLYDSGPGFGEDFNAGTANVIPALQAAHQQFWNPLQLNTMVLSHGDRDHIGGAVSVLKEVQVDDVLAYPRELYDSKSGFQDILNWQLCRSGESWMWDGVSFTVLWPERRMDLSLEKSNNRSCVIRVSDGKTSVLLTGDIESRVERKLLEIYEAEQIESDLLIAPHHGSKTSSSQLFLERVNARVIIFSSGYRNRFSHPHPSVVERAKGMGMALFNTADFGEIDFESWRFNSPEQRDGFHFARVERDAFWRFKINK